LDSGGRSDITTVMVEAATVKHVFSDKALALTVAEVDCVV
jgi:predicted dehydrogenase